MLKFQKLPIYNSNDSTANTNARPVSVLNIILKLLVRLIKREVRDIFREIIPLYLFGSKANQIHGNDR